jgi:hypothetical protein
VRRLDELTWCGRGIAVDPRRAAPRTTTHVVRDKNVMTRTARAARLRQQLAALVAVRLS